MKYRKKPVVIEAYQTDKEMDIETLEGTMHASVGDYIITGVRGEQYPCKPDIFKQTYEPADAPTASPWHRVEDGLPEEDVEVLISYRYKEGEGDTSHVDIDITSYGQMYFGGREVAGVKHWRPPFEYFSSNYEVIAWMPLPEPPKEDA